MQTQQYVDNTKAGEILFSNGYDKALIRAYVILGQQFPSEGIRVRVHTLMADSVISASHYNINSYPLIIKAAIVDKPRYADVALSEFLAHYKSGGQKPVLCLPTVLGLLGAIRELDKGIVPSPVISECIPLVCEALGMFCFGGTEFDMPTKEGEMKLQKGLLSDAVAAFVRETGKELGSRGHRLACVMNMFADIEKEVSSCKPLSTFGEALLDEFSYKLFGTISTLGRVKALTLLQRDIVSSVTDNKDRQSKGRAVDSGKPPPCFGEEAPACPSCGHSTVRNGAMYKCLNCGELVGAS